MRVHPLLARERLCSDVSHASFDPYTFIERHRFLGAEEMDRLQSCDRFIYESVRIDCALFHERIHWNHLHATTIGAFLSFLRFSQENTAFQWLSHLSAPERAKVMAGRFGANSQPIVGIDQSGSRTPWLVDGSNELNMLRQIWHDHLLVQKMLYNSSAQDAVSFERGEVLGEVIGDVLLILHERAGSPLTGPEAIEARTFFRPPDSVAFVRTNGERITTRSLMEAHATSSELMNLLRWALNSDVSPRLTKLTFEDVIKDVRLRFSAGDYGTPARAFVYVLRSSLDAWQAWAPTFHLILDLALNPPLPPLVTKPPNDQAAWRWADIYPPYRFVRLCNSAAKIGLLKIDASDGETDAFARALCERSGIVHWLHFGNFNGQARHNYDFNQPQSLESLTKSDLNYFDYLVWTQSKLWQRRRDRASTFHEPCSWKWGPGGAETAMDMVEPERRWARAPFGVSEKGNFGRTTGDDNLDNWLLYSSILHYVGFDIVAKTGGLELDAYPPNVADSQGIRDFIRRSLSKSLDFDMSQCL